MGQYQKVMFVSSDSQKEIRKLGAEKIFEETWVQNSKFGKRHRLQI